MREKDEREKEELDLNLLLWHKVNHYSKKGGNHFLAAFLPPAFLAAFLWAFLGAAFLAAFLGALLGAAFLACFCAAAFAKQWKNQVRICQESQCVTAEAISDTRHNILQVNG